MTLEPNPEPSASSQHNLYLTFNLDLDQGQIPH